MAPQKDKQIPVLAIMGHPTDDLPALGAAAPWGLSLVRRG